MIEIFNELKNRKMLDYGSTFDASVLRSLAGIELPETGTREDFKNAALKELNVADFIRGRLIGEGKYFASVGDSYRVLLPSENSEQVKKYMKSADGKLKRAMRLYDNTPKEFKSPSVSTRVHVKQRSIRDASDRHKALF